MHFSSTPKCTKHAAYYVLHFTPVTIINQQFKWRNFSFCNIIPFPMSLSFPILNDASSSSCYRPHNFSNKNHYVCTTNDRTVAVLKVVGSSCKFYFSSFSTIHQAVPTSCAWVPQSSPSTYHVTGHKK